MSWPNPTVTLLKHSRYNHVKVVHLPQSALKGSTPVTVRQKLTESETTVAVIIGGGLFLIILGLLRAAVQAGISDANTFLNSLLIGGGALAMVIGLVAWLMLVQPWKNFDDWSKPLYTGHEDHAAHDEHQAA